MRKFYIGILFSSQQGVKMVDFSRIRQKISKYDSEREKLIKQARVVLRASKQLIYSVHRDDLKSAASILAGLQKEKGLLDRISRHDPRMRYEGSYSEANQEYVEAVSYYHMTADDKIPSITQLKVTEQDYLLGICDLTGELTRKAIALASKGRYAETERIKKLVEDIFGEFLKFDLRGGLLRKKVDSVKYNLVKLEDVMYDIKVKGKSK
ncbi:hypothetical protein GF351_03785 [Candidatus Woesearchaeota archaeon]|nr:hypothetical protein [Candidatus Woesearchaeota archaeon]